MYHFCLKKNIASITNKRLLLKKRAIYKFILSLETVTFHNKKVLKLIIW